ncbi:hypothetical protein Fmac_012256 [Flemingia macrophylla]|uniref:Uncharacterized protein n=1 Tax=Flemingia macrophylla TaxID=520843 RepID=A0ABD1MPT1_9FABA
MTNILSGSMCREIRSFPDIINDALKSTETFRNEESTTTSSNYSRFPKLQEFMMRYQLKGGKSLQNESGSHDPAKETLLLPVESINYMDKWQLNYLFQFENVDIYVDEQILEQNRKDTKSMSLEAVEELWRRPKYGQIYNELSTNVEVKGIENRLKHLSENPQLFSVDEAIEIADAAYLLRLLRKPNKDIEMAGQMAHRGALLRLQADVLYKKSQQLLEQSKSKLNIAFIFSDNSASGGRASPPGKISMVDAERRLLANALQDPDNQQFVLLSDSCVPLYHFNYIYDYLMYTNISFVDWHGKQHLIDFFTMKQLQLLLAIIAVCKLSQVVSSGLHVRKRGSISVKAWKSSLFNMLSCQNKCSASATCPDSATSSQAAPTL